MLRPLWHSTRKALKSGPQCNPVDKLVWAMNVFQVQHEPKKCITVFQRREYMEHLAIARYVLNHPGAFCLDFVVEAATLKWKRWLLSIQHLLCAGRGGNFRRFLCSTADPLYCVCHYSRRWQCFKKCGGGEKILCCGGFPFAVC